MHSIKGSISRLRRRGDLTWTITEQGVCVALKKGESVVTLRNKTLRHLLSELEKLTKHWPDIL